MAQLFRKILCPVDFDDNSMAALDLACKVAAQNEASLCLMHVVPFPLAAVEIDRFHRNLYLSGNAALK